jgi:hypothetical protein
MVLLPVVTSVDLQAGQTFGLTAGSAGRLVVSIGLKPA